MSQQLDPPPPVETYSALNKLGAQMFFQMMETHGNQWKVFDYNSFNGIIPMQAATNDVLKHFLVEQEIETWRPGIPEDIFIDDVLDLF